MLRGDHGSTELHATFCLLRHCYTRGHCPRVDVPSSMQDENSSSVRKAYEWVRSLMASSSNAHPNGRLIPGSQQVQSAVLFGSHLSIKSLKSGTLAVVTDQGNKTFFPLHLLECPSS